MPRSKAYVAGVISRIISTRGEQSKKTPLPWMNVFYSSFGYSVTIATVTYILVYTVVFAKWGELQIGL